MTRLDPAEHRTRERLEAHYRIERELSDRLRHSTRDQRLTLYSAVYDELFRRVPDHPLLTRKVDDASRAIDTAEQMLLLEPLLRPTSSFLEVGAGDCALSRAVARRVAHVTATDVSEQILSGVDRPANLEVKITDGITIPAPDASVDVIYSNQVMEHLHPDDAREQLGEIVRALRPGGAYVCVTPNRLTGPHDISRYFDASATGFHLREYTTGELSRIFLRSGFRKTLAVVGARSRFKAVPVGPIAAAETLLGALPSPARTWLARGPGFRWMLGIRLIGIR